MLIDLKEPKEIHNEMKLAGECIIDLIKFCHNTGVLDGKFDKEKFLQIHNYQKYEGCCLMEHPEAMRNRMEVLFKNIPTALIPQIIAFLEADQNYVTDRDSHFFQFSGYLNTLKIPTENAATLILETISQVFGKLYNDFFGHKKNGHINNNREMFKEEYRQVNSRKENICPACLGQLYLGKAQLDHYFPKSQFPALVMHPYNLVPICMECNSAIGTQENKGKGERIPSWPLSDYSVNSPGCLVNVYIPFIRSAEKKISAKLVGAPGNRVIEINALSSKDPIENERIKRFVATFNLEKVWTDRIPFHYNILMQRTLSEFTALYEQRAPVGQTVEKNEVGDYLWYRLVLTADEDSVYEIGYQFEFLCYAVSIATVPVSFHAFYTELIKRLKKKSENTVKTPHFYDSYIEPIKAVE
ncbi:hypothetical protein [Paenibacillus taichungensis]|uniref:hypothetical protein n=1 Tax=Paenibacillus taichungensis TaxID=484184 RepID=UPI0038D13C33